MKVRLLGEYECKMDAKGRMRMPSDLLAQLDSIGEDRHKFVINRGFEKCLMLYPKVVWEVISEEVDALNLYDSMNRDFVRYFYRGAQPLALDSADRILIKDKLLKYAAIEKEVTLMAYKNRIEIWDKTSYDRMLDEEPDNFSDLAQQVLGDAPKSGRPDL